MSSATLRARLESSLEERLFSTLLLRERTAPLTVPIGIAALDTLTGGLPRGALSEITGPASSGRTGVVMAALAAATRRQEVCALVDASDSFDPASAVAAGVDLDRLLWVRCKEHVDQHRRGETFNPRQNKRTSAPFAGGGFAFGGRLEQVLKVTDLLLQGGGFGMVVLDLGDIPVESARRVPLTSWFRFRRAVEPTATVLLLVEYEPCAKTCASLVLRLHQKAVCTSRPLSATERTEEQSLFSNCYTGLSAPERNEEPSRVTPIRGDSATASAQKSPELYTCRLEGKVVHHAELLRGIRFYAEVARSWAQRKPPQSAGAQFELHTTMG